MSALLALAERCEETTGPNRELDRKIALVSGWTILSVQGDEWLCNPPGRPSPAPRYTASLDAALTLVPEEWTAWELKSRGNKTRFYAEVSRMNGEVEKVEYGERCATPALALCAAALSARAHLERTADD